MIRALHVRSTLKALLVALAIVVPLGCSGSSSAAQSEIGPTEISIGEDVRRSLERLVADRLLPGATVVIAHDDRVLVDVTVGYADLERREPLRRDALFRLYSMSKPITSVAIMMLAEQGKLSLRDPAEKYLPELRHVRVYASGGLDDMQTVPLDRPITGEDLLTHNSGIAYHFTGNSPVHQYYRRHGVMRDTPVGRMPGDGPPARSLDELVERIGKAPLLHQPGDGFHYSYSTTVLGAIIERVTGRRLDEALQEMLFTPLGMKDAGFFVTDARLERFTTLYNATADGIEAIERPETSDYRDPDRLLDGGGALVSTAEDYLRFARMLANGGTLEGRRYLSPASVRTMFSPHVRMAGAGAGAMDFGYGFAIGDAVSEAAGSLPAGTVSWSGSGNTYFLIDPQSGMIGLLMTHELVSGAASARSAQFRSVLDRAFVSLDR